MPGFKSPGASMSVRRCMSGVHIYSQIRMVLLSLVKGLNNLGFASLRETYA